MHPRIIPAALLVAALAGCSSEVPEPAAPKPPELTGNWIRHGELGGRELILGIDSAQAVFDSEVDTIFRYQYRRRGNVMEFEDFNGVKQGRVVKHTADSLVLALELPGTTRPMRFWRDRRDPGDTLRIGSRLYDADGELWGTVVGMEFLHRFPNGVIEAGVLVDHGSRAGKPRLPPQWVSRRSAERFTRR